jgi:hypothetical protein
VGFGQSPPRALFRKGPPARLTHTGMDRAWAWWRPGRTACQAAGDQPATGLSARARCSSLGWIERWRGGKHATRLPGE